MLKNIIDLLQIDDFIEESYNIQVAKGLYAMPKKKKKKTKHTKPVS